MTLLLRASNGVSSLLLLAFFLPLASRTVRGQNLQGCANTCPPVNYGSVVPALCVGDAADAFADTSRTYPVCHPTAGADNGGVSSFRFEDFRGEPESGRQRVTVVANYYTGCNAGRRESGVFAHVAQRFYDKYGPRRTAFIQSVKGGGTCEQWAGIYQGDAEALFPGSGVTPREMPLTVDDVDYSIRDDFFTAPFNHPSYVILDSDLKVRHKFVGPCCGYESYYDCTPDIATGLNETLSEYIEAILAEGEGVGVSDPIADTQTDAANEEEPPASTANGTPDAPERCRVGEFSEWSPCSVSCGDTAGIQFRWRSVVANPFVAAGGSDGACPAPVETRSCAAEVPCEVPGADYCIPEFGSSWTIREVASGFDSPRDVAFHPTPGFHLGNYSEGRTFHPEMGEEAWVINGANHSISIVASLGTERQTTISRRDRGYYHYLINGTALSFNMQGESGRSADRDSFNYFAVCNDNLNTYLGKKEPNYFMGPTLYNTDPANSNLVNRLGEVCGNDEPCYFLHSDMLHEAPACIGMAHDPEIRSAYGNVYWSFDSTGNRNNGQLVRFDFQQPHGPGSMDHSIASVRRYTEIELERGPPGVHAGMAVHPTRRELYISVPGSGRIVRVNADSGSFARTARQEYPIYSNALPSFEYSIWECVDSDDFADGIEMPSGLALGPDGDRLFVAERATGDIHVYEVATQGLLYKISTGFKTIGGLSFSPSSKVLHFVDDETNTLNSIHPEEICTDPVPSRANPEFSSATATAHQALGKDEFALNRNFECVVSPEIPDSSFFDQVHDDSGYADDNPDVQSEMAGMDAAAALLANRTDCGYDSELNFDALLLGGYFCHQCLPDQDAACDSGGRCTNVQWLGYTCDNEFVIVNNDTGVFFETANGTAIDPNSIFLKPGITYRFTARGESDVCVSSSASSSSKDSLLGCAKKGPILVDIDDESPPSIFVHVEKEPTFELRVQEQQNTFRDVKNGDGSSNASSGISAGAIAGIVIAVVGGLAIGAFGIWYFIRKDAGKDACMTAAVGTKASASMSEDDSAETPPQSP